MYMHFIRIRSTSVRFIAQRVFCLLPLSHKNGCFIYWRIEIIRVTLIFRIPANKDVSFSLWILRFGNLISFQYLFNSILCNIIIIVKSYGIIIKIAMRRFDAIYSVRIIWLKISGNSVCEHRFIGNTRASRGTIYTDSRIPSGNITFRTTIGLPLAILIPTVNGISTTSNSPISVNFP